MAELFGKSIKTISEHIRNIFNDGELDENVVIRKFRTTTKHGAISSQTAAELICRRFDASLPLLGMQSYDKNSSDKIRKADVGVVKNYLNEEEIKLLGLLVEQYLAFAETMAQQHTPMYMKDWIGKLDSILQMNGRELLNNAGKISHKIALEKANSELDKYKEEQKKVIIESSIKELEKDIKMIESEVKKENEI